MKAPGHVANFRHDGICQRCERGAFSFAIGGRWVSAYIGGLPPDKGRMTCLACMSEKEREKASEVNGEALVECAAKLLTQVHGSSA